MLREFVFKVNLVLTKTVLIGYLQYLTNINLTLVYKETIG